MAVYGRLESLVGGTPMVRLDRLFPRPGPAVDQDFGACYAVTVMVLSGPKGAAVTCGALRPAHIVVPEGGRS